MFDYKSLGRRLREARELKKYTQQDIADYLGVKYQTVSSWERGVAKVDIGTLNLLCEKYGISLPDTLRMSVENSYSTSVNISLTPTAHRIGQAYEKATPPVQRTVEVALEPYMDEATYDNIAWVDFGNSEQAASAGTGVLLDDQSMVTIKVRLDALPKGYNRAPDRYFGVPVAGDSMEPRYHDGDILIVSQAPVNVGEIGVFTMDGEGYVKKMGVGVLHSLNPEYADIPMTTEVLCNGKVVGILDPDAIAE